MIRAEWLNTPPRPQSVPTSKHRLNIPSTPVLLRLFSETRGKRSIFFLAFLKEEKKKNEARDTDPPRRHRSYPSPSADKA